MVNCERCGRPLRSKASIEREPPMGDRCARMAKLEKDSKLPAKVQDDLTFLKMEIKMLKRQIKALTVSGVKSVEAIERIKQDVIPRTSWEGEMKVAIKKELKSMFSDPDWKDKILHSVDEQDSIREPPKAEEVN